MKYSLAATRGWPSWPLLSKNIIHYFFAVKEKYFFELFCLISHAGLQHWASPNRCNAWLGHKNF